MKRHRFLFGASLVWLAFGGQISSVGVKADQMDDLLRASSASIEALNGLVSDSAQRIQDNNRLARELSEQSKSLAAQSEKLIDQLKDEINDLNEKIKAIEQQTKKLKELAQKLDALQAKMATLLPKIQDSLGQDQSVDKSRQILAAISQDRAKASKLIQAIEENRSAEVGSLLGQGARGPKVEVREVKSADGAMVVFRVGNLIHCLSTKLQCGGKASSLTKAAGTVPSAAEAIKPVKESLTAAGKQTIALNKSIERFQRAVESMRNDTSLDQSKAAELQNAATQMAESVAAHSQASSRIDTQLQVLVSGFKG